MDHEQRRARGPARAAQSGDELIARAAAAGVQHVAAAVVHVRGELRGQPQLARPRDAGERHDAAPAGPGPLPPSAEPGQLLAAARQRRRRARVKLGRQLAARLLELQRGVLAQDRLVQAAQVRAGLDPHLRNEPGARRAVGVECLRLAPAAVEREHVLAGERLAPRMRGDDRLQLDDEIGVPARGKVGLEAHLERDEAALLQARGLAGHERLVREVGEGRTAPQRERLAQRRRGVLRTARGERVAAVLDELLEARGVELAGQDPQPSALRKRETWTCTVFSARGGASSPHRATARLSALTGSLACMSRRARTARGLAPPTATTPRRLRTSSWPRIRNSIG